MYVQLIVYASFCNNEGPNKKGLKSLNFISVTFVMQVSQELNKQCLLGSRYRKELEVTDLFNYA